MDRINRALQGTNDLEKMVSEVLDAVLATFGCDRAFLTYPCDPEADSWSVPMERRRPQYPGALDQKLRVPMDAEHAEHFRLMLVAGAPVQFGPHAPRPLPEVAERFGAKCLMSVALHPREDKAWEFGIHQCSHARIWTQKEQELFQETGRRLADALSLFAANRELQRSEANLNRAQAIAHMGALTASIAHEVNQPLAGVVTSANAGLNWLAANPPNLAKAREALERVRRDGSRAGEVLARIRGLVKRTPSTKALVSVNQVVLDVLALAAGELRGQKIDTALALDPNLSPALGDTIQLQQVLLNLITNAIEAMAGVAVGRRTLRIQSNRGELAGRPGVVVAVSDTGIGFGGTDVAQLFEAFHTTKPQGMGLGLWISSSIIEEHGGRLTAQSNSGPGATFVLTIPAEPQAPHE